MSDPVRVSATVTAARAPLIDDLMTREEACRAILFECLAHIAANIPPVVNGRDGEALHQLRVGLRRLRVALAMVDEASPQAAELNARAKAFTNALGPARDCDVFLDELFTPTVAKMEPQRGFEILSARAEKARQRAWNAAVKHITAPDFARFQDEVAGAAQSLAWPIADTVRLDVLVPAVMEGQQKRAVKRAAALETMDPHDCHRLRIALKKLRYAAEFFAPLYKRKRVKAWLTPLKELQDLLGHLNDVAQVRAMLGRLMMEDEASAALQSELSNSAGLIQGWHQARAEQVTKKTLKRWKRFEKADAFW